MIKSLLGIKSDFQELFFQREYDALRGKNSNSILVLVTILFFTFIALGYAIGGIENLAERMNDPFTNWVNVDVNKGEHNVVGAIENDFNRPERKQAYQIKAVNKLKGFWTRFLPQKYDLFSGKEEEHLSRKIGLAINLENNILAKILNREEGNLLKGNTHEELLANPEEYPCGIILKREALARMGYGNYLEIERIPLYDGDNTLFLPVLAVVEELPNLCDFICSPRLYYMLEAGDDNGQKCSDNIVVNSVEKNTYKFLAPKGTDLEAKSKQFFPGKNVSIEENELVLSTTQNQTIVDLYFDAHNLPSKDTMDLYMEATGLVPYAHIDCADICNDLHKPDYLAFSFQELSMIRAFSKELDSKYGLQVSMNQVESKENFALVSRLTRIVAFILLGFGITSILLFINNLLQTHLTKIKANLGTFKAFGLDDQFLIQTYLKIIFLFLALSMAIAYVLAIIFGIIEGQVVNGSFFDVFHINILYVMVFVFIISLLAARIIINKILDNTPGDLIYGR